MDEVDVPQVGTDVVICHGIHPAANAGSFKVIVVTIDTVGFFHPNTMKNNPDAMFVFRNGDSNICYGNFFLSSGGIRVKEANSIYC